MLSDVYSCYVIFDMVKSDYLETTFETREDAEKWAEVEGIKNYLIEGTESCF